AAQPPAGNGTVAGSPQLDAVLAGVIHRMLHHPAGAATGTGSGAYLAGSQLTPDLDPPPQPGPPPQPSPAQHPSPAHPGRPGRRGCRPACSTASTCCSARTP